MDGEVCDHRVGGQLLEVHHQLLPLIGCEHERYGLPLVSEVGGRSHVHHGCLVGRGCVCQAAVAVQEEVAVVAANRGAYCGDTGTLALDHERHQIGLTFIQAAPHVAEGLVGCSALALQHTLAVGAFAVNDLPGGAAHRLSQRQSAPSARGQALGEITVLHNVFTCNLQSLCGCVGIVSHLKGEGADCTHHSQSC